MSVSHQSHQQPRRTKKSLARGPRYPVLNPSPREVSGAQSRAARRQAQTASKHFASTKLPLKDEICHRHPLQRPGESSRDRERAGNMRTPCRCGVRAQLSVPAGSTWALLCAGDAPAGASSARTAAPLVAKHWTALSPSGRSPKSRRKEAGDSVQDAQGAPCPSRPRPSKERRRAVEEGFPQHGWALSTPSPSPGIPALSRAPYSPRCRRQQPPEQKGPRPGRCPLRCTDPVPRCPHPSPGRAAKSPSEEHPASPAASCLGSLSPPLPSPPRPALPHSPLRAAAL